MELKREMNIEKVETLPSYVCHTIEPVCNFSVSDGPYQSELFFGKEALKECGMENIVDIIDNKILLTLESVDLESPDFKEFSMGMLSIAELKKEDYIQRKHCSHTISKETKYSVLFKSYRGLPIKSGADKPLYKINLKLDKSEFDGMKSLKPKTAMEATFQII